MADFRSKENLDALLSALDEAKESDMYKSKIDDLVSKSPRRSKTAGDLFKMVGEGAEEAYGQAYKPNFTMKPEGANLPSVIDDAVRTKDVATLGDDFIKGTAKTLSSSTPKKEILKKLGSGALKGLGKGAGIASALLADSVHAAEMPEGYLEEAAQSYKMQNMNPEALDTVDALLAGKDVAGLNPPEAVGMSKMLPQQLASTAPASRAIASEIPSKIIEPKTTQKSDNTPKSSPRNDYEKALSEYKANRNSAQNVEAIKQLFDGLMSASSKFDLAGGPQYAGLKEMKTDKIADGKGLARVEGDYAKKTALMDKLKKRELDLRKIKATEGSKTATRDVKLDKEKRLASQFAQTNSQKWVDRARRSSTYKKAEDALSETNNIRSLLTDATEHGGQSLAMLGPKVARGIANEVGVLTQEDVTRYVKNPSLIGGLVDTLAKLKDGKISEVSADNLGRLLDIMETKSKENMQDVYDKNAKLYSKSSGIPYKEARMLIDPDFEDNKDVGKDPRIQKYATEHKLDYAKAETLLKARGLK